MTSLSGPSKSRKSTPEERNLPEPNYHQGIDVDETIDQEASDLGSESSSLRSTSLASTIYDYRYENGRRYHAYRDGKYLLPNDDEEQDRLDFNHHLHRLVIGGKLFRAPIEGNPQRVLDFATGTGIWAIDFADEFPSAVVIGTDLSPIQPSLVPPNCVFYVDDVESEWTYGPDEAFDFIHGRNIAGSIADFDLLYHRIYDHLKPGGWIEIQDYEAGFFSDDDPSLSKSPNCKKWSGLCNYASEQTGRIFAVIQDQKQKLIDAGFVDVHDDAYKVPVGTWPKDRRLKEIGLYQRAHVLSCFDSYTPGLLGRILGWSKDDYQILIEEGRREVEDANIHLYTVFRFIYGRKPTP